MDRMGWYLLSCPLLTDHFHVLILEEIDRYLQSMLSLASSGLASACATEFDWFHLHHGKRIHAQTGA